MLNLNKPTYPTTYIIHIIFSLVEYKQKQLFQIYNKKSSEQKNCGKVSKSVCFIFNSESFKYATIQLQHTQIYMHIQIHISVRYKLSKGFPQKKRENNTGVAYRNIISKTYLELINKNTWNFIMEIQNIFQ